MLELGKYSDVSHENVGKYTENKNIDILFTYGAKAKHIAEGAKGFVDESDNDRYHRIADRHLPVLPVRRTS